MEKVVLKNRNKLLEIRDEDLFLFTGIPLNDEPLANQYDLQDFINHFEEYIRAENPVYTEALREKFVQTNIHAKQNLDYLNDHFEREIAQYHPSVVVHALSLEEVLGQTTADLTESLIDFINQVLALADNQAKFVLLYPFPLEDEIVSTQLYRYTQKVLNRILNHFNEEDQKRLVSLSFFKELK